MNVLASPLGIFVIIGALALVYYLTVIGNSLWRLHVIRRERKEWDRDARRNRW